MSLGQGCSWEPTQLPSFCPCPVAPTPSFHFSSVTGSRGPTPGPWALSCACLSLSWGPHPSPRLPAPEPQFGPTPTPTQCPVVKGADRRPRAGPLFGKAGARRAMWKEEAACPLQEQLARPVLPPLTPGPKCGPQLPPHPPPSTAQLWPAAPSLAYLAPDPSLPLTPTIRFLVSGCLVPGSLLVGQEENSWNMPQAGPGQIRLLHDVPRPLAIYHARQGGGDPLQGSGIPQGKSQAGLRSGLAPRPVWTLRKRCGRQRDVKPGHGGDPVSFSQKPLCSGDSSPAPSCVCPAC